MPFQIRSMGIYMVVDTTVGLILMWDKKTSIFIKLSPSFQVYFKSENINKMNAVTYSYVSQRKGGNLDCKPEDCNQKSRSHILSLLTLIVYYALSLSYIIQQ